MKKAIRYRFVKWLNNDDSKEIQQAFVLITDYEGCYTCLKRCDALDKNMRIFYEVTHSC